MGRLLDIARAVPLVKTCSAPPMVQQIEMTDASVSVQKRIVSEPCAKSAVSPAPELSPGPEYCQPVADVLDILVNSGLPILHSQIAADMAERGYSKPAAYKAIADAQGCGWIEHNLTTGYVLTGESE